MYIQIYVYIYVVYVYIYICVTMIYMDCFEHCFTIGDGRCVFSSSNMFAA